MKVYFNLIVIFLLITAISANAQSIYQGQENVPADKSLSKFIGNYLFKDGDTEKNRSIVLIDQKLFYYVDENLQIPLKPITETSFNLYPSQTNIYFEFNQDGEIEKVKIKKSSGGIMVGRKLN